MTKHSHMFRMQLSHLLSRKEHKLAWVLSFAVISLAFVEQCLKFWGADRSALMTAATGWIGNADSFMTQVMQAYYFFCICLLAALPFSDSFLEDRKGHNLAPLLTRGTWKEYRRTGACLCFISGFLVTFVPLLVSQILSFLLFPASGGLLEMFNPYGAWVEDVESPYFTASLFPAMRVQLPYLYNLMFIGYSSLFAGMNAVLAYLVSLLGINKKLLVIAFPALFWLLYDSAIDFLSRRFSYRCYLYPNHSVFKETWFFFAILLFLFATVFILYLFIGRRKREAVLI